jgi:bacterioferritin
MKPLDKDTVGYLNRVLKNELTAINQYYLHAKMLENMGLGHLAKKERDESMDEMKHADELMERILFLEGLPNLQDLGKLYIGEDVREMLECDLKLEMEGLPLLREVIGHCERVNDYVTRMLIEKILDSEEEHIDWIETQLGLIDKVGLQNYVQSQMSSS